VEEFAACWEGVEDPRTGNAALHEFHELLMIALCGGQGAVDMALFARAKEPFLRGFKGRWPVSGRTSAAGGLPKFRPESPNDLIAPILVVERPMPAARK